MRRGFDLHHLGTLFGISTATASRVVTTWLHFLREQLGFLLQWPTRAALQNRPVDAIKYFRNTIAVLDCTEFRIQKASSTVSQRKTWSSYKHQNTVKLLVACTPSGTITFVSELFTGSISDKSLVSKSGILDLIQPGDNVLADRGFLIRDSLAIRGATLNIPPFARGKQLSMHATTLTRRIARARVVVERAIGNVRETLSYGTLKFFCGYFRSVRFNKFCDVLCCCCIICVISIILHVIRKVSVISMISKRISEKRNNYSANEIVNRTSTSWEKDQITRSLQREKKDLFI